jgi:ATP synthase protein I
VAEPRPPADNLEARLKAARATQAEREGTRPGLAIERSRYGAAWRLSVELVAGLVVGAGMGWLLDNLFGTRPWLTVVFFFLGAGAGIRGVYRAAREMNRDPDGSAGS